MVSMKLHPIVFGTYFKLRGGGEWVISCNRMIIRSVPRMPADDIDTVDVASSIGRDFAASESRDHDS